MTPGLMLLALAGQPQLTLSGSAFVIKDGAEGYTVPLSATEAATPFTGDKLSMRIGDTLITFDQRGLGIQYGSKGGFTRLGYVTTNPKIFSSEEIAQNSMLAKSGERPVNVSAVSGFEIVNDRLYMLLRWEDESGKPWLETLVDIDTSGDAPKVGLIGRFGGLSFTSGPVSDELHSIGTELFVALRGSDGLAVGKCDTKLGTTRFKSLGQPVDECQRIGTLYYTVTNTTFGLKSIGVVDPVAEKFRVVMETRGSVVPSSLTSTLVVRESGRLSLFAFYSGAKLEIADDSGYAQTPYGVLVWFPKSKPTRAHLRETDGWSTICEWKSAGR